MGLQDLNIKLSYADKGQNLLKDFLLPAIEASTSYDRITSFYTIESLLAISQGIQSLYEKKGKMRLIIGIHSFPPELVEASLKQDYLREQIKKVRVSISTGIQSLTDSFQKERLATIAWMIQDGLLEVKAAAVKGDGIFHPKTLLLSDSDNNKIVAVGSPNETGSGLGGNFEQIMIAKSWESPEAVDVQEQFFESLWYNQDQNALTYDITEETAGLILGALGDDYRHRCKSSVQLCDSILRTSASMTANYFVSGEIPALYMHQERAVIDALSRWPIRVLFSDEVGLGKTFEVAATMEYLIKYCGVKKVIILTPKSVLQQWQDELYENFHINTWLYDSSKKNYIDSSGQIIDMGSRNPLGRKSPDIVLMSAQLARGSRGDGSLFDLEDTILPDLLIVDEAHSARVSKGLSGTTKKTRMYSMLERVSRKIPHIILATATPMQKDANEYLAMLKLLGLPKAWQKERNYKTSLRVIVSSDVPDISDAYTAAYLLFKTISIMKPSYNRLDEKEVCVLNSLLSIRDSQDSYRIGVFVQENWPLLRSVFIKLHPAHLLTIRNTRRSLTQMGYHFPKRNLMEESIEDSMAIQLFYNNVNEYLITDCFSVETALYPKDKPSIGFVRVSYQQRVASSLYSCKRSLERRLEKVNKLKKMLDDKCRETTAYYDGFDPQEVLDDFDLDEQFNLDGYDAAIKDCASIDITALRRAVGIESTALTSLCHHAESLLRSCGDMKICRSIQLAKECMNRGDAVLLFSRYTDTIDALLNEFKRSGVDRECVYGVYTGKTSEIIRGDKHESCDKSKIKDELFSGRLKIMFCSDAASEGLNLQAARVLINVDVPWTPSRLEQRIGRIARLGQTAKEVDVYNVWYPYSIEARMYHRIQRRLDETSLAIGEFPEVVATNIKLAVIDNADDETTGLVQLNEIRNSFQVKALEELWSSEDEMTTISKVIRDHLITLCNQYFCNIGVSMGGIITKYLLPNGYEIGLTSIEGMPESISLSSEPWKIKDFSCDKVLVKRDENNHPVVFITADHSKMIKYSSVVKLLTGKKLDEDDYFDGYPQNLPNACNLDLCFAVDNLVQEKPIVWIE